MTTPNAKPRAGEYGGLYDKPVSRAELENTLSMVQAERDALVAQNRELVEALAKSADSFRDLRIALNVLGRPVSAQACEIAEHGARALLAKVRP